MGSWGMRFGSFIAGENGDHSGVGFVMISIIFSRWEEFSLV